MNTPRDTLLASIKHYDDSRRQRQTIENNAAAIHQRAAAVDTLRARLECDLEAAWLAEMRGESSGVDEIRKALTEAKSEMADLAARQKIAVRAVAEIDEQVLRADQSVLKARRALANEVTRQLALQAQGDASIRTLLADMKLAQSHAGWGGEWGRALEDLFPEPDKGLLDSRRSDFAKHYGFENA